MSLTLDEMETAIMQSAQDRRDGYWEIFTDDPYWIRRLDGIAECIGETPTGKRYRVEHRQITIRKPRRMLKPRTRTGFKKSSAKSEEVS